MSPSSSSEPVRGPAAVTVAVPRPIVDPDAAFDVMVRAHYASLGAFAYRLVNSRPAAEDVVHEVLVRVWRRRASFAFDDPLPYLYQAVRNEAMSWHRRETRARHRAAGDTDGREQADTRPGAQQQVEARDLARVVAETIEGLPERRREIFRMQREQGLTYAQIAKLLGISIKTVEVQMGRALKAIRLRAAPFLALTIAFLR